MPRAVLKVRKPVLKEVDPRFFPSGGTLLDLINGGGWAKSRFINVVGDKSTAKTGFAIEACTNFSRLFSINDVRYNESEAAFDRNYAATLGFPDGIFFTGDDAKNVEDRHGSRTVEEWADDLDAFLAEREGVQPSLYVLDSLDALSDTAELEKKRGEASYGTAKAKLINETFRKLNSRMERSGCTLLIISQIRDNIGVMFGEKHKRQGGHALDFYASQIVWLYAGDKIKTKVSGVERVTGVKIKVMNKKNKMGNPFRSAEMIYHFNYGIDDEISCLNWLKTNGVGRTKPGASNDELRAEVLLARKNRDRETLDVLSEEIRRVTKERWAEIEEALTPPMPKY